MSVCSFGMMSILVTDWIKEQRDAQATRDQAIRKERQAAETADDARRRSGRAIEFLKGTAHDYIVKAIMRIQFFFLFVFQGLREFGHGQEREAGPKPRPFLAMQHEA